MLDYLQDSTLQSGKVNGGGVLLRPRTRFRGASARFGLLPVRLTHT